MGDFQDYPYAFGMRDAVEKIAARQIESERPRPRYGTVVSIDRVARKATVQFPEGGDPIPVTMGTFQPIRTGVLVRVAGLRGDRYIDEIYGFPMAGEYLLETVTLTEAVPSIDFVIPLGFRELILRSHLRSDVAAGSESLNIALNGDTSLTTYYKQNTQLASGTNTTASTQSESLGTGASRSFALSIAGATAPANSHASLVLRITEYANPDHLTHLHGKSTVFQTTATTGVKMNEASMWWNNPAIVELLTLTPATGLNFVAGSDLALYGLL